MSERPRKRRRIGDRSVVIPNDDITKFRELVAKKVDFKRRGVSVGSVRLMRSYDTRGEIPLNYTVAEFVSRIDYHTFVKKNLALLYMSKSSNAWFSNILKMQLVTTLRDICTEYDPSCRAYCAGLSKTSLMSMIRFRYRGLAWIPTTRLNEAEVLRRDSTLFQSLQVVMCNIVVPQELIQLILAYYPGFDRDMRSRFGLVNYTCYRNALLARRSLTITDVNVMRTAQADIRFTKRLTIRQRPALKAQSMKWVLDTLTTTNIAFPCLVRSLVASSSNLRGLTKRGPTFVLPSVRLLSVHDWGTNKYHDYSLTTFPRLRTLICSYDAMPRLPQAPLDFLTNFCLVEHGYITDPGDHNQRFTGFIKSVPNLRVFYCLSNKLYGDEEDSQSHRPCYSYRNVLDIVFANLGNAPIQELGIRHTKLEDIRCISRIWGTTLTTLYMHPCDCPGHGGTQTILDIVNCLPTLETLVWGDGVPGWMTPENFTNSIPIRRTHALRDLLFVSCVHLHYENDYMYAYVLDSEKPGVDGLIHATNKIDLFKFVISKRSAPSAIFRHWSRCCRYVSRPELPGDQHVILVDQNFNLDQVRDWKAHLVHKRLFLRKVTIDNQMW